MSGYRRPRDSGRGQGLVEFALVFPIFVGLLFGLIDMGRAVYTYNTLAQAAREGARLAAVESYWVGKTGSSCAAPVCPADTAHLRQDIVSAVNRMTVGLGAITSAQVTFSCASPAGGTPSTDCALNNTTSNLVTVSVAYTYSMLTPFVGQIVNNIAMSGSATMAIN